ncbi:MAG: hypothetical protein K8S99_10105 [Planctomycetes bacterium]|nr:hypothetical protein [Planctomycetota bacterium]
MADTSNHPDKQEIFRRVWRHCREESCHPQCGGDCSVCRPREWVVSRILGLVEAEGDKSIRALTPSIRRVVEESRFVTEAGDPAMSAQPLPPLERQVELVIRTLEQMKQSSQTS